VPDDADVAATAARFSSALFGEVHADPRGATHFLTESWADIAVEVTALWTMRSEP
jgi:hypothetical protein